MRIPPRWRARFHSGVFGPQVITLFGTCAPIAQVRITRSAPQAVAAFRTLIIRERSAGFPFRMMKIPLERAGEGEMLESCASQLRTSDDHSKLDTTNLRPLAPNWRALSGSFISLRMALAIAS